MSAGRVSIRVGVVNTASRAFRDIQASSARAAASVRANWENISAGMNTIGTGATAFGAAAAGIGAIAVNAEKKYRDMEKKTLNSLDVTKAEAEKISKEIAKAYQSGLGESLESVTDAYVRAKQMFGDLNAKDLNAVVEGNLNIVDTFDELDQQGLNNALSSLTRAFGVTAEEAQDYIVKGLQRGLNFKGDLTDAITEFANNAKDATVDIDDFFTTLQKGKESGIKDLSYVGDSMKEAAIRIRDGSASEALTIIGEDAKAVQAEIEAGGTRSANALDRVFKKLSGIQDTSLKAQAGVGLLGSLYEDNTAIVEVLGNTESKFSDVSDAMEKLNKNSKDSASREYAKMWRETEASLRPLGAALMKLGTEIIPPLANFVTSLADKFSGMSDGGKRTTLIVTGLFAALGPLLLVLPGIVSAVGLLAPAFTVVAGAIAGITAPIALAVAGGAALIAVGVAIYKNWDSISASLKDIWKSILSVGKSVWGGLTDFFGGLGEGISNAMSGVINFFVGIPSFFGGIVDNVKSIFGGIIDAILAPFNYVLSGIESGVNKVAGFLGFDAPAGGNWMPKFHSGGVVSGAKTSERLALLQGGERVLTASQNARYEASMSNSGGGYGSISVPVMLDGRQIAHAAAPHLSKRIQSAKGGR